MFFNQFATGGNAEIHVKGYDRLPPYLKGHKALEFFWEITPHTDITAYKVDLNISFSDNDLPAGMDLADIEGLFRFDVNTQSWEEVTSTIKLSQRLIRAEGVTEFSMWAIGERDTFMGEPVPATGTWSSVIAVLLLSMLLLLFGLPKLLDAGRI